MSSEAKWWFMVTIFAGAMLFAIAGYNMGTPRRDYVVVLGNDYCEERGYVKKSNPND